MSGQKYNVGESVNIPAIFAPGVVRAVLQQIDSIKYRVSYWSDGVRKEEWFYVDELEACRE